MSTDLSDLIPAHIRDNGPVSFHDFMEMCLYYPGLGYYTAPSAKTGRNGDYYTAPYIGKAFGAMIAAQLAELWQITGKTDFSVIEIGAGSGMLAHDILDHIQLQYPSFNERLHYHIIEKSDALADLEKTHLSGRAQWHTSLAELPATGHCCILSNELIDNLAIHRVVMAERLEEVYVDYHNGYEEQLVAAHDRLHQYFETLGIRLPHGYATEVNLEAIDWLQDISSKLERFFMITFDYGYRAAELYNMHRYNGTLACYYRHSVHYCPYIHIGQQDITAHVNFTALEHWGKKSGIESCGYTDLAGFTVALGIEQYIRRLYSMPGMQDTATLSHLQHLLLVDMGRKIKVLLQQKGYDHAHLTGCRYRA